MKMQIIPSEGKDKVYWDILNAAIELDIKNGHQKWTYAQLSRKSSVTRSLIYYYFGKSKLNILEEACRLFGELLAGTSKTHMQLWKEGNFAEPLRLSRELLSNCKMLLPFYFLNRDQDNSIGKLIREYEHKGNKKRKEYFPHLSASQSRALFALQMGISTYPALNSEDLEIAVGMIQIPKKS